MSSIFLINDNKIVSRLLQLSSDKHGYSMEEKIGLEPSQNHYDIVLVDSDRYSAQLLEDIREQITFQKLGYIGIKNEPEVSGFDMRLDKPFLPSDFVTLIAQNLPKDGEGISDTLTLADHLSDENEELNLDAITLDDDGGLDDLTLDDELDSLDELEELDLEELPSLDDENESLNKEDSELDNVDLSLDSAAVMSTGVAQQFVDNESENSEHEDLVNILDEIEDENDFSELLDDAIDEKKEAVAAEDSLDEEILETPEQEIEETQNTDDDLNLSDISEEQEEKLNIDDDLDIENTLEDEIPQSHDEEEQLEIDEEILKDEHEFSEELEETAEDVIEEELPTLEEDHQEHTQESEDISNEEAVDQAIAAALGAGAVAAGATMLSDDKNEKKQVLEDIEDKPSSLDALEGIEDIEQESYYIVSEDFDSLNEEDIQKVMSGETLQEPQEEITIQDPQEIIVKEEFTTDEQEETMVESNDVEKWIRDAVAKAITPEMIKEALNDMQINVTLDFTKKDS